MFGLSLKVGSTPHTYTDLQSHGISVLFAIVGSPWSTSYSPGPTPCRLGEQKRFSESGKRLFFLRDCVRVTVGATLCVKEVGNPSHCDSEQETRPKSTLGPNRKSVPKGSGSLELRKRRGDTAYTALHEKLQAWLFRKPNQNFNTSGTTY